VHHGGFFVGQGSNKTYVDEKINWFDHVEVDTWSPLLIDDLVRELNYPKNPCLSVYWLLPGKTLSNGLRLIYSDSDTLVMASLVHKEKNFVLYLVDSISSLNWDDIVANPVCSLPKVISPMKNHNVDDNQGDRYDDEAQPADAYQVGVDDDQGDLEDGSEEDPDFVDSDNEVAANDEDLFEFVDVQEGTKMITNGQKNDDKGKQKINNGESDNDMSTDEDVLELPNSDGEGEDRVRFQSFRQQDTRNPMFKVGQMFASPELLRQAITEYSLKQRVEIKMPRNERKRIKAHCEAGCPWNLYASVDSRSNGMVIKSYYGQHSCQKKWVLKRCTSRWLANNYLESLRADQNMTLTNFSRIVQKEWNLTPSRSKLARARRLAMKQVLGDEEEQYKLLWSYGHEIRRSNPGSTFFVHLEGNIFSTLYMSLDACKRGFLTACRPIICLDGCHIKTKFGGQILTAVGIDPNDCIYPIAIAIVEVESLATWKWFLETLKNDLGIQNTYPWTIMTDKQKVCHPLWCIFCTRLVFYVDTQTHTGLDFRVLFQQFSRCSLTQSIGSVLGTFIPISSITSKERI
jgi:hypothetical protein